MALFIIIVLIFTVLLKIRPQTVFILFLGLLILFYLFFNQYNLFLIGNIKIYFCDFVIASLFIYTTILIIFSKKSKMFILTSTKLFILFYLLGYIQMVRGMFAYSYSAIGESREYIFPLLYYLFIIIVFKDKNKVNTIIKWILYFGFIMIIIHIIIHYSIGMDTNYGVFYYRFINSSEALLVSFIFISLLSFTINKNTNKNNILSYLSILLLVFTIIFTQHRSVWLSTLIGLLITVIHSYKKILPRIIIFFLLILLASSIIIPSIRKDIFTNFDESLNKSLTFLRDPMKDPTGSWRLIGWQQRWEQACKNPLFGEGLGGYSEWYVGEELIRTTVHNGYIMLFAKFGITGMLILFTGIYYWFMEIHSSIKKENNSYWKLVLHVIRICIIMHLVYVCFYYITIFFWILIGIGTSLILEQKNSMKHFNY